MTNNFSWIGINTSGQKITGKIFAENKIIASKNLENNNITILSLKKNNLSFSFFKSKKFTGKYRLDFTQQLQLLLQAGIPLVDSLTLIAKTSENQITQSIVHALKEKIIAGMSFSDALHDFPEYFDQSFCKIIFAGEQSAQLDIVLTQLIDNQEHRAQLKNKISKALFYPISVLCIAIFISIGLLIFVIPQFKAIYDNFGAQLPTMTRCLISISHDLSQQGALYLLIIGIITFLIKKMVAKNLKIKNKIGALLLKTPCVQSLIITRQIAQWSQLLTMTLSSGIPLIDALTIANQAIAYAILQTQMQNVRDAVIAGKSLHAALEHCRYFPLRAKTMISIGENADVLPFMMKKIALMYQQKLNDMLDRLSKLLEPVIMVAVASLVSGLIIAMYLPIFKMGNIV